MRVDENGEADPEPEPEPDRAEGAPRGWIGVIPNARRTELARWLWFCCGCGCVGDGARELAFELDVVERPNGTLLGGAIA